MKLQPVLLAFWRPRSQAPLGNGHAGCSRPPFPSRAWERGGQRHKGHEEEAGNKKIAFCFLFFSSLCSLCHCGESSALAADEPKETAAKKELEKIQGNWTVASAELDGKPDPARINAKITYRGDTFTRTNAGQTVHGKIKMDPTANPKTMDATYTDGPNKDKTLEGIYSLEGEALKICASPAGKKRPTEFSSKAGQLLLVLHREKPKPPPAPVFTDKNLEQAVRQVLHEPQGELTNEKLQTVSTIDGIGKNISKLDGLEKCKNLLELKLSKNQIVDLTPLKDLTNLQSLDLSTNKIAEIGPLKGLIKLQYIELSNNQITKVDALSGMTSLSALYISGNQISDLAPLASLTKLSSLSLAQNRIKDVGPLAKVTKLFTLDLNDNQIEDVAPLAKEAPMTMLLLERNKISDLTPLVTATKADAEGQKRFAPYLRLYLKGNPLSEAAKSSQLPALKGFGVRIESL